MSVRVYVCVRENMTVVDVGFGTEEIFDDFARVHF